jgi:hypothetical protein
LIIIRVLDKGFIRKNKISIDIILQICTKVIYLKFRAGSRGGEAGDLSPGVKF